MKVKELIKQLQSLEPESEVFVSVRKGYRPISVLKQINGIEEILEQDTNRINYYIDVDIDPM